MGTPRPAFHPPVKGSVRLSAGCIALLIAACAVSTQSGVKSASYVVTGVSTQFYKYGPAQAFGADLTLAQGQRVTMLARQFGFSRVMLGDGTSGFVSNDELKPAPPAPSPRPTPAPSKGLFGRGKTPPRGPNFAPSSQPLFDVNDVPPPPLPSNPSTPSPEKPKENPTFRY